MTKSPGNSKDQLLDGIIELPVSEFSPYAEEDFEVRATDEENPLAPLTPASDTTKEEE